VYVGVDAKAIAAMFSGRRSHVLSPTSHPLCQHPRPTIRSKVRTRRDDPGIYA
jgi:hypothetical protein